MKSYGHCNLAVCVFTTGQARLRSLITGHGVMRGQAALTTPTIRSFIMLTTSCAVTTVHEAVATTLSYNQPLQTASWAWHSSLSLGWHTTPHMMSYINNKYFKRLLITKKNINSDYLSALYVSIYIYNLSVVSIYVYNLPECRCIHILIHSFTYCQFIEQFVKLTFVKLHCTYVHTLHSEPDQDLRSKLMSLYIL